MLSAEASKGAIAHPLARAGSRVIQIYATDKKSTDYLLSIQAEPEWVDPGGYWPFSCCRGDLHHGDGERRRPSHYPADLDERVLIGTVLLAVGPRCLDESW